MTEAANDFGFRLFNKLYQGKGNVCLSPFSISQALCMTYNGAAGKTREEMAAVLGIQQFTLEQVNAGQLAMRQAFRSSDPKVTVDIANALWINPGDTEFKPDFIARNKASYDAPVRKANITNNDGVNTINKWVEKQTKGNVHMLLKPGDLDSTTRMVLTNAVYFKGIWTTVFDKKHTTGGSFRTDGGLLKGVPMMQSQADYAYAAMKQAQIIALPYGSGRLRMVVVLPSSEVSLPTLVKDLTPSVWRQWTGSLRLQNVTLLLPRFKAEYEEKLNKPLQILGMPSAFRTGIADFSGMNGKHDLFISLVCHKALLEVNEDGTTAAASTAVVMKLKSISTRPVMAVNHPFLCAIEDTKTGAILFLAAIGNPQ